MRNSLFFKLSILVFVILLFSLISPLHAYAAQKVNKIEISGAQRIEESTIASYMDLKIGDEISDEVTDRVLKNLFATGLFTDVRVSIRPKGVVFIEVIENPIVNAIYFEGNEKISDEELLSEIQLRQRQVFTRAKVRSDVSRLYQIYRRQGRFSVSIQPKIVRLDQNRVDLVFEIHEGDITKIKSIRFVGNEHYSDRKLRSVISSKESAWYRFISSSDRYDADRLSYDKELVREFYLSKGYVDFKVISATAELSNDKTGFFITFTVEEGERYKVSSSEIISNIRDFDSEVLRSSITFEEGDWYNLNEVKRSAMKMTDKLGDLQYAFVDVRPDIRKNTDDNTVVVVFSISESPRVFVERINVNGNIRTLDKVLRREMELVEGDPFNRSKLLLSERNIRKLNFFENVDIEVSQGSAPDKTIIDINVQEKSTGELSLGAGFSSTDGPLADVSIRERNLLGKGQDLLLSTTLAGKRSAFNLSFTEPYFLDRDILAGIDLFHTTRDLQKESSYDQRLSGGGFRLGYPLSQNWRQTLRYRIERNEIDNVNSDASRFIRDQEGKRTTSAISQRLFYDTRDSSVFATSGMTYWLDTELAGLGGDAKYISAKTGASYYYPISDNVVLNILGEGGAIQSYGDSDIEINERFFLGGSTLRGFERSGVGPRDAVTNDSLGGNFFYRGSVEVSFPIGLPKELGVRAHTFSDFGSLWDIDEIGIDLLEENSIRASAGVGISWKSPFGPIRLDYAIPYSSESYDKEEKFRFDFGTRF